MSKAIGAARDRRLAAKELRPVQQPSERPAAAPRLQVDQRNLAAIMHLHFIYFLPEAMMDQIAEARVGSFDQLRSTQAGMAGRRPPLLVRGSWIADRTKVDEGRMDRLVRLGLGSSSVAWRFLQATFGAEP